MGTLVTKQTEHDEYENTHAHKYINKITYDGWLGNLTNQPTNEASILSLLFWPSQSITNVRCVNLVNDVVRLVLLLNVWLKTKKIKRSWLKVENSFKEKQKTNRARSQNIQIFYYGFEKNCFVIVLKRRRRRVHLQCCFVKS